jgi:hypothetical protein
MSDFSSRFPVVAIAFALAACTAEPATPQGQAPGQQATGDQAGAMGQQIYQGRFTGPVVPITPNCGLAETGRLRFTPGTRAGRFTFEQGLGAAPLYGEAGPDGTLRASPHPVGFFTPGTPPPGMTGPGQPPRLEATLRRGEGPPVITGTLVNGLCRWNVTLRAAE